MILKMSSQIVGPHGSTMNSLNKLKLIDKYLKSVKFVEQNFGVFTDCFLRQNNVFFEDLQDFQRDYNKRSYNLKLYNSPNYSRIYNILCLVNSIIQKDELLRKAIVLLPISQMGCGFRIPCIR